ncbi:MAG: Eco57I restriction-modification methylase domain-containing protein [Flavobacteriia bacterium]|nr:Eco57I restriction-modification methylase domain-containing protein [Flavobacteriia bacterium]
MELKELKPRITLNKAYLKIKPNRSEIEGFKFNLIQLLDRTNDKESEEFHKNLVIDFLKKTYYEPMHFVNTKGRNDLVIHNGADAKSSVGVIIEAKKPTNKAEMLTKSKINVKAFQELVLYFLRERITLKNLEIKYLIATNINEWFIFDANFFEKIFAQNKTFVKQFTDFENGTLTGKTTDFFYKEIAEPFIAGLKQDIEFTHFDIRDYDKPLRNNDKLDDRQLIALFKLLSPEHLLKLPFANDSNTLDKRFYGELLHIIGLTENKVGGKKIIERLPKNDQNTGSLIENAIIQLDSLDKIGQLNNPSHFGDSHDERLFNVGLELVITWVNRILFLKLLEAQLITYHKGDKTYSFLNIEKLHDYDDLNSLFFQVLAKKHEDRNKDVKSPFEKVPYLNSSLFEPTGIEHGTIFISNLRDDNTIPVYSSTVLKDENGKKKSGEINALAYLYEFLSAYDFSSEGSEEIQEDNKTLINASVLGLIFEKINGYKDGSFFTPGFITMYMCRETIRKAVVQKFNETKGWNVEQFEDLYDKIEDRTEANKIVDSLKICDPAVGSGHFLVSALNEVLAIKNDLKILQDRTGKRLKEYQLEVVNDELIVTDEEGELYEYNPKNKESQRIQETLFHEKQRIIENCLFGVDINPNSVKICRLRLWIELLKSAYYKSETELETLPNIDINIKCGNSLISRFDLDADLSEALKKSKWNIQSYRLAVDTYRNAKTREVKREMESFIQKIKRDFKNEIFQTDPKVQKLKKIQYDLGLSSSVMLFHEPSAFYGNEENEKKAKEQHEKKAKEEEKLRKEIDESINNKIYDNSFEWRFEFPEVLDDNGNFIGFDVVIGNPPYVGIEAINFDQKKHYETKYETAVGRFDLYTIFIEKAESIQNLKSAFSFIIPGKFLNNKQFVNARKILCKSSKSVTVIKIDNKVFDDAQVDSVIVENYFDKKETYKVSKFIDKILTNTSETIIKSILQDKEVIFRIEFNAEIDNLLAKIEENSFKVKEIAEVKDGIIAGRVKDILYVNESKGDNYFKLFFGKHLSKYNLTDTEVWVNYNPEEVMKEEMIRVGGKGPGLRMRNKDIFQREKILSRFVAKEIIATYDNENRYYEHTLHSTHVFDKRFNTKYVLGLFNSSLLKFYYHKTNSQGGDIFPQVRISSVENLPIKIVDLKKQEQIISLVDKILKIKEENPVADTTELETEIDKFVFKFYELTEEEIKFVKESEG